MALRDYYRCKKCDAKIAYGPDRPDEDWEPFLLCRKCLAALEHGPCCREPWCEGDCTCEICAPELAIRDLKAMLAQKA